MTTVGLIPRNRLGRLPPDLRLAHEYCFFLHDHAVAMLIEYEKAQAHFVKVKFRSKIKAADFTRIAEEADTIEALRATGYPKQARRVILNNITMAMVSDCLNHIFEALRCLEKQKFVVAINLLRKPLTDNLLYLSWMLGDEDGFYTAFCTGPEELTPKRLGNRRDEILAAALTRTPIHKMVTADYLIQALFNSRNEMGLYGLFQHAVHLITAERLEIRTDAENFNFIFKRYDSGDIYDSLYRVLSICLFYLTHVIAGLFDRMRPMDKGAKAALFNRSSIGLSLVLDAANPGQLETALGEALSPLVTCDHCGQPIRFTRQNVARVTLAESFRCTACRRINSLPYAWLF